MTEQNNAPLTMREACEAIGWTNENKQVTVSEMRKLRRKLMSAGRALGKQCVFGGGDGRDYWTTPRVLASLRLLPEDTALYADFRGAVDDIHDRLDLLSERVDAVTTTTVENAVELRKLAGKMND